MKLKNYYALFFALAITCTQTLTAQDWVAKMQDPSVNFYEVQKDFNKYFKQKEKEAERQMRRAARKGKVVSEEDEVEVPGYFQYKRWEWFMAPRVEKSGKRFNPSMAYQEYQKYQQQYKTAAAGNWTLIGPTTNIPTNGGAGRLTFVRFDPTNNNIIYVGAPAGGLWKSTDGGATWSTNTDQLAQVIGCTDIAIDPTNTNIMYLATGDGDAGDTYSVGILKSTDGGLTWNTTGLSYYSANYRQISKVLINPNNTNVLLVATSGGVYRSDDAAATFTQVQTGSFKDMEFKPGDPNTVYACGGEFYKTVNNGLSWTKISGVLPAVTNVSRMAVAVTPADPNNVYLIVGLPAPNYGTEGFYKSTNSGTSFTKLGAPALGNQQWYDLAIAVSPTNANEVILGGQTDFLRSTNGGSSWSQNGGFTHVDYHDIVFVNSTTYFIVSDGGVYKTTNNGSSWTDLSNGLQIAQMYGFGQSTTNPNLLLQGWQDNGTNRYNGSWSRVMGGDGMLCFIDWNNDQNMWGEQYGGATVVGGSLNKSTNGGNSWSGISGITEAGAWVTPWLQDPVTATTIYAGFVNVWRSLNGGTSWTKISNFSNTGTIVTLDISPANNQVIWVTKAGALYKTANGGTTWTTITNVPSGSISSITCDNVDPNKAWITYSGFTNSAKVFQTNDQGLTWINLSGSIPNIPVNYIKHVNNSNDGLYIGTDIGVFYKDATLTVWQPFNAGLPIVPVTQLAIYYPTGKLRASTYGRGMWESDLYVPGSYAPTAAFSSNNKISCPGTAVQFTDYSAGQPTAWNWTFTGANITASTLQNPLVFYNTPGNFPVTLTASNTNGTNSTTYANYINISSSPIAAPATAGTTVCGPTVVNLSATGSGTGTLRWWDAPGGGNVLATGPAFSPNINGTQTFYVDEDFPAGLLDYTGENSNAVGAGAYFTANDIRGLYFDIINPVILNSVQVYSGAAGNRTIEVLDGQGNTVVDTTVFIPANASLYTVPLNFTLYPGNNYFIKCRGLVDLYRNSAGAVYPYVGNSAIVTNSNAGSPGYYYFFYNWELTEITCNTSRSACTVIDSCSTQGLNNLSAVSQFDAFPNPNNGEFTLKFNTLSTANYAIEITNTLGQKVYTENLPAFNGSYTKNIDLSEFGKGLYMLSITEGNKKATKKLMVH
jgi:photosystem II stability/assembly factor-like uncharacterized protein/PKD repeat protein